MRVFIGYDQAEDLACRVAAFSLLRRSSRAISVEMLDLRDLRNANHYRRPTETQGGKLFDVISDHPMSTSHALARFFIPKLDREDKWAIFMDGDMLVRTDIFDLDRIANPKYAVMVVKHDIEHEAGIKKSGDAQTHYKRKNWSSFILWNLRHPGHFRLKDCDLNQWPGLKLHQFGWLRSDEIGALPATWNHLVGVNPKNKKAKIVHFTLGMPSLPKYRHCEYAREWRAERRLLP